MIGPGLSFHDVPVIWQGQPALVQARRIGNRIQLASIRIPSIRDDRGRIKDEVFGAVPVGERDVVAFEALDPEDRGRLIDQVAQVLA